MEVNYAESPHGMQQGKWLWYNVRKESKLRHHMESETMNARATVETLSPPIVASRFWTMMKTIWANLDASGTVPRSEEEVENERRNFRDEWDERQVGLEQISDECDKQLRNTISARKPMQSMTLTPQRSTRLLARAFRKLASHFQTSQLTEKHR